MLSKKGRKSALKAEVDCLHEIFKDFSNKSTNYAGKYDREALEGLYKANVIEFDIDIEGIQFEVVRDTKNFIANKTGFEQQLGEVLKLCEKSKEIKTICELTDIRPEVVKDCLGILSRLGFLDVQTVTAKDWHKSWQPLSDAEDSVASLMPSIEINNCEDPIKITLAVGTSSNPQTVKAVKDVLGKFLVEIIESPNDAVALNSTGIDPIVFTNLSNNEAPLYRLFKLKYCRTSPVIYFVKGFVLTTIPSNLAEYTFFLMHTDTFLKEIHKNDLLSELSDTLPLFSVFLIPLTHRFLNKITMPLPINTLAIKDRSLSKFLRDLNLFTHFEHFVGYIEIALLTDKNYLFLNQYHGIPLNMKEIPIEIANSLIDAPWFKYNNLEVVAEAQQNEIFQYREFICDIDLDPGFILIT